MISIIVITLIQLNIIVTLPKYTYDLLFISYINFDVIFLIDFKVSALQNHRSSTAHQPPTTDHPFIDRSPAIHRPPTHQPD